MTMTTAHKLQAPELDSWSKFWAKLTEIGGGIITVIDFSHIQLMRGIKKTFAKLGQLGEERRLKINSSMKKPNVCP